MAKKILIIDDDVELCEEIAEILRDEGHFVQTVSDDSAGRDHINKNIYDIIILDYRMPKLNGVEILRLIKDKDLKGKIFIVSGRPFMDKLLKDENASGLVAAVINKPFDAKTLLEKINAP